MDTKAVPINNHEAQWTQPWLRVQSQRPSTGAIVSNPHLHRAALRKADDQVWGLDARCNDSY